MGSARSRRPTFNHTGKLPRCWTRALNGNHASRSVQRRGAFKTTSFARTGKHKGARVAHAEGAFDRAKQSRQVVKKWVTRHVGHTERGSSPCGDNKAAPCNHHRRSGTPVPARFNQPNDSGPAVLQHSPGWAPKHSGQAGGRVLINRNRAGHLWRGGGVGARLRARGTGTCRTNRDSARDHCTAPPAYISCANRHHRTANAPVGSTHRPLPQSDTAQLIHWYHRRT